MEIHPSTNHIRSYGIQIEEALNYARNKQGRPSTSKYGNSMNNKSTEFQHYKYQYLFRFRLYILSPGFLDEYSEFKHIITRA